MTERRRGCVLKILFVLFLFTLGDLSLAATSCQKLLKGPAKNFKKLLLSKFKVRGILTTREVLVALPEGKAPQAGWPSVVFYQGSYFKASFSWPKSSPFGGYYESVTLRKLVEAGYAVVVPRAAFGIAWQTNILLEGIPVLSDYKNTDDYTFLKNLFRSLEEGELGPLDSNTKFAAGMSSGGYNTSRMALDFPGEFKAFMIHSASFASFLGPYMPKMPHKLPKDHPPTLFLHGDADLVVPAYTVFPYFEKLSQEGLEVEVFIKEGGGHEYFKETPDLTLQWFERFK